QMKLRAFLGNSFAGASGNDEYLKAVLCHRTGRHNEAISILQKLLKTHPNDRYYKETLAQVFYENGWLQNAINIYEQIYQKGINILIKIDYARALIEARQKIDFAIQMLESAKYQERFESEIYRLLGKAYGIKKREGVAMLMLAQEQMLEQNYQVALEMLQQALSKLNQKTEKSYIKKAKELSEILQRELKAI
ncbi:MAG: tetratricopeptide repeat protein, partial [Alphaproteobacteria bacterium]|nr:tetratricopeptide repeat protein [Alphaproteobacteria bacterium]